MKTLILLVAGFSLLPQSVFAFGRCGYGQAPCADMKCCQMRNDVDLVEASFAAGNEAPGTLSFVGLSSTHGTANQPCFELVRPNPEVAQTDADQQAGDSCRTQGRRAVRVSDFSFQENDCVASGQGYRFPADFLYASADYQCL